MYLVRNSLSSWVWSPGETQFPNLKCWGLGTKLYDLSKSQVLSGNVSHWLSASFCPFLSLSLSFLNISTCYNQKTNQEKIYNSTGLPKWCFSPLIEKVKTRCSILYFPSAHLFLTGHHGDSYKKGWPWTTTPPAVWERHICMCLCSETDRNLRRVHFSTTWHSKQIECL